MMNTLFAVMSNNTTDTSAKSGGPSIPRQITAEQLLREATDGQPLLKVPATRTFQDETELNNYRMVKRKEFEDKLRRHRHNITTWLQYAKWEETQQEFRRVRSIFERALQVDYQNVSLWLKYIEMEISNKFIQHARTLYDRVTTLLPKVEQFWFKYAYMEEKLENYAGARAIYDKWMGWQPGDNAWLQYVKFEERCGEIDRARKVFERYIAQCQSELAFIRYCKFEERNKDFDRARAGFETCIHLLDSDKISEGIFLKYAQFEARRGDIEKAKRAYSLGLSKLGSPERSKQLYEAFVTFTKQTGSLDEIETMLIDKRRAFYEKHLVEDPDNYDVCFNYMRMEEEAGDIDRAREIFERSISKVPLKKDKKHWTRYVYLWLFYAQFEESVAADIDRARNVYETALKLTEQVGMYFFKLYKCLGEFELRQLNIEGFRKCMNHALSVTKGTKHSIPRFWIETELKLGNTSKARHIAARCIEITPSSSYYWLAFIDLELALAEPARAASLCEVAFKTGQVEDLSSILRKQIEIESENIDRVREIFRRLIQVNPNDYRVYYDFAEFEFTDGGSVDRACSILEEGLELLPEHLKSERQQLRKKLSEFLQDEPQDDY